MSEVWATVQPWCQGVLLAVKNISKRAPGSPMIQALVVGALVGFLAYKATQKRYRLPPGPLALPLLGNLLYMRGSAEAFYVTLQRWAKETYGPVVMIYFGPVRAITLNDAEVANEAFVKKGEDFADRLYLHSLDVLTEGSKDITMASYSPTWKLQRKITMQALRRYMSGKHLEKVVQQKVGLISEKMAAEPGPFDPHRYNSMLMFHIIDSICFARNKPLDDPDLASMMSAFDKANDELGNGLLEDVIPLLRYWPTKRYVRIMGYFRDFREAVYKQLNEHKKSFSPDNIRDLTDNILLAQMEAAREERAEVMAELTDTHVAQTINDMFGAGVGTSMTTLDWAFLYMAGHPQTQKRAQEEIDSVTGPRMPEAGDRPKLPFTQAVVYETLRLGTMVPTGVPRRTRCDTTVGGYDVPKGTMVLVNQWALLHSPDVWSEPEQFSPERFLDEQGKLKKMDSWTPFSAGRRACLGESVAKPELLLILSCLLKRFTISLPEGAVYDPNYDVKSGLMSHQPKPYKVVIKPRY